MRSADDIFRGAPLKPHSWNSRHYKRLKIGDPDAFFSSLYRFFLARGVVGLIVGQVCSLLSLAFTVALSSILLCCMNWKGLVHECRSIGNSLPSPSACQPLSNYIINPSKAYDGHPGKHLLVLLYPCLLSCFFLWRAFHAVILVRQGLRMNRFYKHVLEISQEKLRVMTWTQVISSLKTAHSLGAVQLPGDASANGAGEMGLEMEASLRLLRTSNYLIALVNAGLLDCSVHRYGVDTLLKPQNVTAGRVFLSTTLEWAISFVVLEHMLSESPNTAGALLDVEEHDRDADGNYFELGEDSFWPHAPAADEDHFHLPMMGQAEESTPGEPRVSHAFLSDWQALQWRFRAVGTVLFLLLPFTLAYSTLHFLLKNAQPMRSGYLGPRRWSPAAQWAFREYNELPHYFSCRLERASDPASKYLNSFPQPTLAALSKCASYISGALAACLVVLSVAAEGALLSAHWGDHNLLWWLAVFSSIYAAARACAPDEDLLLLLPPRSELLTSIGKETHYFFKNAVQEDMTYSVLMNSHAEVEVDEENAEEQLNSRVELAALFPHQALLFVAELVSTLVTPLCLVYSMSSESRCRRILSFLRAHTRNVPGTGAVCALALFDFEKYVTAARTTTSAHEKENCHASNRSGRIGGAADTAEKMEASFISFARRNPSWRQGPLQEGGQLLLSRINAMKALEQEQLAQTARSRISSLVGTGLTADSPQHLPAVLQSVLAQQGINWESDHFWLARFRHLSDAATKPPPISFRHSPAEKTPRDGVGVGIGIVQELEDTADSSLDFSSDDEDTAASREESMPGRGAGGGGRSLGDITREKCKQTFRAQASV